MMLPFCGYYFHLIARLRIQHGALSQRAVGELIRKKQLRACGGSVRQRSVVFGASFSLAGGGERVLTRCSRWAVSALALGDRCLDRLSPITRQTCGSDCCVP